jgi:hypothetical protein
VYELKEIWKRDFLDTLLPIRQVSEWIRPFLELSDEEEANPEIVRHHRRILRWGATTGFINSFAWTSLCLLALLENNIRTGDWDDAWMYLFAPVLAIASFFGGTFVGVPLALAISPKWFLTGPAGERWMGLIGTRKLVLGRFICVIGGLATSLVIAFPLLMLTVFLVRL